LTWTKNLDLLKKKNFLYIKDINEIYNGVDIAEHSIDIKKYIKANPIEEKLCNTYIYISYNNNKDSLNLKCDNVELTLRWFKALKSLLNTINNIELKKNESKSDGTIKKNKNLIKEVWEKCIFKNWEKYGSYFLLKISERNNFYNYLSNDLKQSTKNEILDEKKNYSAKYINNFLENLKDVLNKKDKELDLNDFYFLCSLGFPFSLRRKIWPLLIGNSSFITDNLYDSLKNKILQSELNINFEEIEKKYKINNKSTFNKDASINIIITDILNAKSLFINEILEQKMKEYKVMLCVYRVTRVFFLFRKDIPYNKTFIDIIFLFSILEDKEELIFKYVVNFVFNNNFIKLLTGNEEMRKETNNKYISFFNKIIKCRLPNIESHFSKLEIIPELYFIPWMEDIYIKVLNTKIILPLMDFFLLNGEYILFQVGLTILKITEADLMNMTISQALNNLKKLPDKYNTDKFFEIFNNFSGVKSDYVEWKRENELNCQKKLLNL
jgi:hypothetical protein